MRRNTLLRIFLTSSLLWPGIALCDEINPEIQRNLLQREQQQQELQLKMEQSRQLMNPNLTPSQKRQLESLQLDQRLRQQQLQQQQIKQFLQLNHDGQTEPENTREQRLELQRQKFRQEQQEQMQRFKHEEQNLKQRQQ
jgi:hypothetical protein